MYDRLILSPFPDALRHFLIEGDELYHPRKNKALERIFWVIHGKRLNAVYSAILEEKPSVMDDSLLYYNRSLTSFPKSS